MLPFSNMLYATDSLTLNGSALGAGLQLAVSNTARRGSLIYVTGSVFNPHAIKAYSSYLQYTKPDSFFFVQSEIYGLLILMLCLGNLYCFMPWCSIEHLDEFMQVL